MTAYPGENFLLRTDAAGRLYREFAACLPIIDYHCHLDPSRVAENEPFDEIVSLWIGGDPYKWRAMRINGVPERLITGNASSEEKFQAWAETLPHLVGNPLFHWSAMELKTFFGIEEVLTPENAERIHKACNERLQTEDFRPQGMLSDANVEMICTSDAWTDGLSDHKTVSRGASGLSVLPSLRADQALAVDSSNYGMFLGELSKVTGTAIRDWQSFQEACVVRLDAFEDAGCRMVDLGLDEVRFDGITVGEADRHFAKALAGEELSDGDAWGLRSAILVFLAAQCADRDWAIQFHIGAQRETSVRLRSLCGPAGGYACIGASQPIEPICRLLDTLERQDALPSTVLYPLNPSDTEMLASLTGSFAEDGVPGKIQLGPAWWHNDHADGIERQLRAISAYGMLGRFVGMTTDSRSLLSTVRHDYFRRVFCNLLGEWIEAKSIPDDETLLRPLIEDVCYRNANRMLAPLGDKMGDE